MLPYGPRTSLGINERGPDRRAGTRRASDAGDLSRSRLAQARRHMKTEGERRGSKADRGAGLHMDTHMWYLPTYKDNKRSDKVKRKLTSTALI